MLAVVTIVLAVGIILYPLLSTAYNQKHQSRIFTEHTKQVTELGSDVLTTSRNEARAYNDLIKEGAKGKSFTVEALVKANEDYGDQLNIVGDGIMGYVEIPQIKVKLPIFHGTDERTLTQGVGHLLGSSLPVGGAGTHSILTAHSGMASNRMFSDLPEVEVGDVFYLHVLGERLTYRVDQIKVTLPEDTTYLAITEQEDQCTLVTCTPFGVNTHRLLVRGTRISAEEIEKGGEQPVKRERTLTWTEQYVKGALLGLAVIGTALGGYGFICWRRKHRTKGRREG